MNNCVCERERETACMGVCECVRLGGGAHVCSCVCPCICVHAHTMYWAPGLCDIWGIALFNGAAQVPPSGDPACALLSQEGTRLLLLNPWSVLFGLTRRGGTHCPRTRWTLRKRGCWRRRTVAICRSLGLHGTRTYRCTARSKPSTRTPTSKSNTKACSRALSKGFLRRETRACWKASR